MEPAHRRSSVREPLLNQRVVRPPRLLLHGLYQALLWRIRYHVTCFTVSAGVRREPGVPADDLPVEAQAWDC